MKFFDGLYSYEIVMLALGVLMFLVLLFAFVYQILKQRPFVSLLAFFLIPIVLIGFPGISSVKINKDLFEIQTKTRQVEQNPQDPAARQALQQAVGSVGPRQFSDPQALTTLARAQLVLGEQEKAEANVDKALATNPQAADAGQLKQRIDVIKDVDQLTKQVEARPTDDAAKAKLQQKVTEVARQPIASPVTFAKVARAQSALGEQEKAKATLNTALKIDPQSAEVNKAKEQIQRSTTRLQTIRPTPSPQ